MEGSRRPVDRFEGLGGTRKVLGGQLQRPGSEGTGLLWDWGSLESAGSLRDLVAPSKSALEYPPHGLSPPAPGWTQLWGPAPQGPFPP